MKRALAALAMMVIAPGFAAEALRLDQAGFRELCKELVKIHASPN